MLAHYTSVDGFNGIVTSDTLRMTRSEFMNDPSDCKMLGTLIEQYLKESNKKEGCIEEYKAIEKIYEKVTVMDYIKFIQDNIPLYVLSFTDKLDEMEFWNYYGNGGAQLNIDEEQLIENMCKQLGEEEYLICAPVKYASNDQNIETICLSEQLGNLKAYDKNNESVFEKHMESGGKGIYQKTNIKEFVDSFVTDYVISMQYLYKSGIIDDSTSKSDVLKEIFKNQNEISESMIFKKDLLMYMISLSALIKTSSYEYENEKRIVYFHNTVGEKRKKDQYELKSILDQKYIRPYIEFKDVKLYEGVVGEVLLSPLTRNVPIDDTLYKKIIKEFMQSNHYGDISVENSKHKCRW